MGIEFKVAPPKPAFKLYDQKEKPLDQNLSQNNQDKNNESKQKTNIKIPIEGLGEGFDQKA